ncbi:hypothetical protein HPB50_009269 [Hyalomma asiaticum]|uniref:Uncharacterized protein n=1 Tax=Hyalomma asiaticum TaxID=266040 RepID=A0ACB7RMM8_HYAAI|nr:hypothetical protein HPB50_009269 [Hyalomma asiaticum]
MSTEDVDNVIALAMRQQITEQDGNKMAHYMPVYDTSIAGVICDIDLAIPNTGLPTLIKA